jgi:hypothetical protein
LGCTPPKNPAIFFTSQISSVFAVFSKNKRKSTRLSYHDALGFVHMHFTPQGEKIFSFGTCIFHSSVL